MTAALQADLEDAARRLRFGVGTWIHGKPHLTAQVDWDRRPSGDAEWSAVKRVLRAHHRISHGHGGISAQNDLQQLAEVLDPRNPAQSTAGERLQRYQLALTIAAAAEQASASQQA